MGPMKELYVLILLYDRIVNTDKIAYKTNF